MKAPYEGSIESAFGWLSELTTDDDLLAKLRHEKDKLKLELDKILLSTKTNPFVDGFVKILIAFRDIILPMLRPVGAFYLSTKGVDMAQAELAAGGDISAMSGALSAAFPGWMGSRHQNKNKSESEKTKRAKIKSSTDYDPDFDD